MPVYWIWFANLKGLSLHKKQQLLESFQDPEEIWLTDPKVFSAEIAQALKGAPAGASTEELVRFALRNMVMKG